MKDDEFFYSHGIDIESPVYKEWKQIYSGISRIIDLEDPEINESHKGVTSAIESNLQRVANSMTVVAGSLQTEMEEKEFHLGGLLRDVFWNDTKKSLTVLAGSRIMQPSINPVYKFLQDSHSEGYENVTFCWTPFRSAFHFVSLDGEDLFFEGPHLEFMPKRLNWSYSSPKVEEAITYLEETYLPEIVRPENLNAFGKTREYPRGLREAHRNPMLSL